MKLFNFNKKNKTYKKIQKILSNDSDNELFLFEAYKLKESFKDIGIEFVSLLWDDNSLKILFKKNGVKLMTDNIYYFSSQNVMGNIYEKFEHFKIQVNERTGKIEIFKGLNDQFYFRVKATNGEIIAVSEGYTTKQNCFKGIESLRYNMPTSEIVDLTMN